MGWRASTGVTNTTTEMVLKYPTPELKLNKALSNRHEGNGKRFTDEF